jgi:hypothetical protein
MEDEAMVICPKNLQDVRGLLQGKVQSAEYQFLCEGETNMTDCNVKGREYIEGRH